MAAEVYGEKSEMVIIPDNILTGNYNRSNSITNQTEFYKKLHSPQVGVYRGYGKAFVVNDRQSAQRLADQRALAEIARIIKVTIGSVENMTTTARSNKFTENIDEIYSEQITSSTLATLKNAKPTRWYDPREHIVHTIMEVETNTVNKTLRELDQKALKESKYYFKKALTSERECNYSQALQFYFFAYYIASQHYELKPEYYDARRKNTYDIQIEAGLRFEKILKRIKIEQGQFNPISNPAGQAGYAYFKIFYEQGEKYPLDNMNIIARLHNNKDMGRLESVSDTKGQLKFTIPALKKKQNPLLLHLAYNIQDLVDRISIDFYGFRDQYFQTFLRNELTETKLFLSPLTIAVKFSNDFSESLNSEQFKNIVSNKINLIFKKIEDSNNILDKILIENDLAQYNSRQENKVILGRLTVKSYKCYKHIGYPLIGEFEGIYFDNQNKQLLSRIKINNIKTLGTNKKDAVEKFKRTFSKLLLNKLQN